MGKDKTSIDFYPKLLNLVLNNKEFKVTKGEQLRDFLYVGDFAEAVNMCLDNKNIMERFLILHLVNQYR